MIRAGACHDRDRRTRRPPNARARSSRVASGRQHLDDDYRHDQEEERLGDRSERLARRWASKQLGRVTSSYAASDGQPCHRRHARDEGDERQHLDGKQLDEQRSTRLLAQVASARCLRGFQLNLAVAMSRSNDAQLCLRQGEKYRDRQQRGPDSRSANQAPEGRGETGRSEVVADKQPHLDLRRQSDDRQRQKDDPAAQREAECTARATDSGRGRPRGRQCQRLCASRCAAWCAGPARREFVTTPTFLRVLMPSLWRAGGRWIDGLWSEGSVVRADCRPLVTRCG